MDNLLGRMRQSLIINQCNNFCSYLLPPGLEPESFSAILGQMVCTSGWGFSLKRLCFNGLSYNDMVILKQDSALSGLWYNENGKSCIGQDLAITESAIMESSITDTDVPGGYHGNQCSFWGNDYMLGIYRLYLTYPGWWCWFREIGIYRFYLGCHASWCWFWENNIYLGFTGSTTWYSELWLLNEVVIHVLK